MAFIFVYIKKSEHSFEKFKAIALLKLQMSIFNLFIFVGDIKIYIDSAC